MNPSLTSFLIKLAILVFIVLLAAGISYEVNLFLNEHKTVKLEVPYFRQQYQNSCESASLRMALAYYGIETDDMEIVKKVGYDPTGKDYENNIWDDPQEMFVGYIDEDNGYGVYGKPIERAAEAFGRRAHYETNVTPFFLAFSIAFGNPVVLWGNNTITREPYTWNTPAGNTVKAFGGEHARLVVGYKGTIMNPEGFYLHDPINGNQYKYWTTAELMENVNSVPGVTNQAVVVK